MGKIVTEFRSLLSYFSYSEECNLAGQREYLTESWGRFGDFSSRGIIQSDWSSKLVYLFGLELLTYLECLIRIREKLSLSLSVRERGRPIYT